MGSFRHCVAAALLMATASIPSAGQYRAGSVGSPVADKEYPEETGGIQAPIGPYWTWVRTFLSPPVAGEEFGASVAIAGDVNGDGYDDLIVGAPSTSAKGHAYIYFGGTSFDAVPDVVLEGEGINDGFGAAVAGAGNVNGAYRGLVWDDVIVGAPRANGNRGKAYVYLGGPAMNSTPDWHLFGDSDPGDRFGAAVACAGDVNGDGKDDLVIGAPGYESTSSTPDKGIAYMFYSYKGDSVKLFGPSKDFATFGVSVTGGVNIGGSSRPDIVVGGDFSNDAGNGKGVAWVFYGDAGMDGSVDLSFSGDQGKFFGCSVAMFRADAGGDVLVGQYGGNGIGKAFLFTGEGGWDATADAVFTEPTTGNKFGRSVSAAGNFNGDSYNDFLIGAPGLGKAYRGYGADDDGITDETLDGYYAGSDELFGLSVAGGANINGDARSDLIVGREFDSATQKTGAAVYISKWKCGCGPTPTPHPRATAGNVLPSAFSLSQNYPNPFNPSTTISFALPEDADVHLTVHNVLGETVATLLQGQQSAGTHAVLFDASHLASGTYFYRLAAGSRMAVKRLTLLK